MHSVKFKHPEQSHIFPKLLQAVNRVCEDFQKDAECLAGYRSLECQKATAKLVLAKNKGSYQINDGSVYIGKGSNRKCLAAAYGKSNHCFCIAMDITGWFEGLTNSQLKKYGLVKPMSYEPWHVQLIEHTGITEKQKKAIRDSCLKGENCTPDIKQDFFNAVDIIKRTQSNPDYWLPRLKEIKYFDTFIMNIVRVLGCKDK